MASSYHRFAVAYSKGATAWQLTIAAIAGSGFVALVMGAAMVFATGLAAPADAQAPTMPQPQMPQLLRPKPHASMPQQEAAAQVPRARAAKTETQRLTELARASDPTCDTPWTYSVGLHRCICIRDGYSRQWDQCLPMAGGTLEEAVGTPAMGPQAAIPLPDAPPFAPLDEAQSMEAVARAQDCLSTLGLYQGAVNGEANEVTAFAFARFAATHGLASNADLLSAAARDALRAACSNDAAALTLPQDLHQP